VNDPHGKFVTNLEGGFKESFFPLRDKGPFINDVAQKMRFLEHPAPSPSPIKIGSYF